MKLPSLILLTTSQMLILGVNAAPKDKAPTKPPCFGLKAEVAKAEQELEELRKRTTELLAERERAKRTRHAPKPDAKLHAANKKLALQLDALQRENAELLSIHEKLRSQAANAKPTRTNPKRPTPPASSPAADAIAVLHFDKNDCTPSHEREAAVAAIRKILRQKQDAQFDLIGHASTTGCAQANLCLSECRAAAVRDLLIIAGIAPRILDTYGLGDTKPLAKNATQKGRAANRRVEIRLYQPNSLPQGH